MSLKTLKKEKSALEKDEFGSHSNILIATIKPINDLAYCWAIDPNNPIVKRELIYFYWTSC